MKVTKAIIAVAGWGTRRLPVTKAIEKCMLPVGNRPIVDYVVQDCIDAGIKDIYLVVSKGSRQIQQYYSDNASLNAYLSYNQKNDFLEMIRLPQGVNFHFIEQEMNDRYGTAIPLSLVAPQLGKDESVIYYTGDDFLYSPDGSSETARLLAATPEGGNSIMGINVDPRILSRYGVIEFDENNNFVQIVEKPAEGTAPSTLISLAKFVLNPELIKAISNFAQLDLSGEYYINDPINQYVMGGGKMSIVVPQGVHLDGGNVHSWLEANNYVMQHRSL